MQVGQTNRARLDRFISKQLQIKRGAVRAMLASGRVYLDHRPARDINQVIDRFTHVVVDNKVLQSNKPAYLMLNKPAGVVSATTDPKHPTVVDLLGAEASDGLHIAGRLDFNSTGLLLLTNDGSWSRRLASPEYGVKKVYRVSVGKPLTTDYVEAFRSGLYLAYEDVTTRPATVRIISDYVAEVVLTEGRYHQIKRMFGQFQNPVLTLHRVSIGRLKLDQSLAPGQSRALTQAELKNIV